MLKKLFKKLFGPQLARVAPEHDCNSSYNKELLEKFGSTIIYNNLPRYKIYKFSDVFFIAKKDCYGNYFPLISHHWVSLFFPSLEDAKKFIAVKDLLNKEEEKEAEILAKTISFTNLKEPWSINEDAILVEEIE